MNKSIKNFIKLLLLCSMIIFAFFLIVDPAVFFGMALLIWASKISSEKNK